MPHAICVTLAVSLALSGCNPSATGNAVVPVYIATVINPRLEKGMAEPVTGTLFVWGDDGPFCVLKMAAYGSPCRRPFDSFIKQIAANDDGNILVAVSDASQILRSEDNGRSWTALHAPLAAVTYHPARAG